MSPQTPYTADLGDREPLSTIADTLTQVRALVSRWSDADFERSYAPGKWTARQILIHLAQTEIALGNRARMALASPNYAAQSFDQDAWMNREVGGSGGDGKSGGSDLPPTVSARAAVDAVTALGEMNRALFASLSASDRQTPFSHPEYGALTVDWLIHQIAGHGIHHLKQLETIATR